MLASLGTVDPFRVLQSPSRGGVEEELSSTACRWFHLNPLTRAAYSWCAVSQDSGQYVLHVWATRSQATVHFRRILGDDRETARLALSFALLGLSSRGVE